MRAIPLPIPVKELHALVHEQLLTDKQIASRLGSTVKRVQNWRLRYGVESLPRWKRNSGPPIEGDLKSLLVGSMLGDGRVVFQKNVSHYTESHSGDQREYLEWKASYWGSWGRGLTDVPDKRGYTHVRFRTAAHSVFNEWRDLFYLERSAGWKVLKPELVDKVDAFALAIWYLDDGYAGWWPSITFGAKEGSYEVARAIFDKFGLDPRWEPKTNTTGQFHMEREGTAERFLSLIEPYVPSCMRYKLEGFGFQGPHYQVRKRVPLEVLSEMASQGVPIKQIARELGVGASTVSRHLNKHGIVHPRRVGAPRST